MSAICDFHRLCVVSLVVAFLLTPANCYNWADLRLRTAGKTVHVNIGVEGRENRANADNNFLVQFDPNAKADTAPNEYGVLLPYLAAAESSPAMKFVPHRSLPGCSSLFDVRQKYPTKESLQKDFLENCIQVNKTTDGILKLWDKPCFFAECTGDDIVSASWTCQSALDQDPPVHYPAVALSEVLRNLPAAHSLSIDAQGADVEILLSLGGLVRRVKEIQMECQTGMWLYKSRVRNDCTTALVFLLRQGFVLKEQEVSNCGLLEYHLIMTNPNFIDPQAEFA